MPYGKLDDAANVKGWQPGFPQGLEHGLVLVQFVDGLGQALLEQSIQKLVDRLRRILESSSLTGNGLNDRSWVEVEEVEDEVVWVLGFQPVWS